MFLNKKNAIYFNKPKQIDPLKPKRILGGILFHHKFFIQVGKMINNKPKLKLIIQKNNK